MLGDATENCRFRMHSWFELFLVPGSWHTCTLYKQKILNNQHKSARGKKANNKKGDPEMHLFWMCQSTVNVSFPACETSVQGFAKLSRSRMGIELQVGDFSFGTIISLKHYPSESKYFTSLEILKQQNYSMPLLAQGPSSKHMNPIWNPLKSYPTNDGDLTNTLWKSQPWDEEPLATRHDVWQSPRLVTACTDSAEKAWTKWLEMKWRSTRTCRHSVRLFFSIRYPSLVFFSRIEKW